jgi:hypothetical protein
MCATCFGLTLGHPKACQYKTFKKEDTTRSKGTLFTVTILTGQFSKSGTQTLLREYYVWLLPETLSVVYRLDKKEDNRGCSLWFILTFTLSFVSKLFTIN